MHILIGFLCSLWIAENFLSLFVYVNYILTHDESFSYAMKVLCLIMPITMILFLIAVFI